MFFPCLLPQSDHNQRDSSRQPQEAVCRRQRPHIHKGTIMAETALVPFEKLDPAEAWQPWQPDDKQPFDLKWAGHLYRRAAFGATLPELRQAVKQGLPATLDRLLAGQAGADQRLERLAETGRAIAEH